MLSLFILSLMLSVVIQCNNYAEYAEYAEYRYAECCLGSAVIKPITVNMIMSNVVMLSVDMLCVTLLNVTVRLS
jgi:hypothetical protein